MTIEQGQAAPAFDLPVTKEERVRLSDFRGSKNVLLVFHPFAFTGICEEEACELRDNLDRFREADTEIVFVSCDPWQARQAWRQQLGADFVFASDFWPHGAAAKAYGVFNEQSGAALRGTFFIDKEGVVRWTRVNQPAERREGLAEEALGATA